MWSIDMIRSDRETVYGHLMHPHRKEYPEDFTAFFFYKVGKHWLDYTRVILVSVDDASGRVVGLADWQKQGTNLPSPREPTDSRALPSSMVQYIQ